MGCVTMCVLVLRIYIIHKTPYALAIAYGHKAKIKRRKTQKYNVTCYECYPYGIQFTSSHTIQLA